MCSLLAANAAERGVTVTGQGEVRAVPDRARVTLGVSTQAKTAQQALAANEERLDAVLASVRQLQIPREEIQTSQLSLHPVYSHRPEAEPELAGYRAENLITVEVSQLDRLGQLVDAAVKAGANQIVNLTFEVSEQAELIERARALAMTEAQRSARQLASLAGARLGAVVAIREAGARRPGPIPMAMEARSADVAIEPGTQEVSYTVEVTYALEPDRTQRGS